jgi:hypothetical protein
VTDAFGRSERPFAVANGRVLCHWFRREARWLGADQQADRVVINWRVLV